MQITIGSKVTMHYALRLADGTVADSSFDNEPVSFVVGDGSLDQGLELALIGLRAGDRQTLTLMPGQAFGARDDAALQWLERDQFPPGMALEEGQIIGFTGQAGEDVAGAVIDIQDQRVRVDFNHPLAGREIEFEVEILSVENPTDQDL
jgi:FKBP-type peptidyl-prolyl cis-trans isomerase SlpA